MPKLYTYLENETLIDIFVLRFEILSESRRDRTVNAETFDMVNRTQTQEQWFGEYKHWWNGSCYCTVGRVSSHHLSLCSPGSRGILNIEEFWTWTGELNWGLLEIF